MAVVIKYVVERNGVERMTFTTKKEADAYDKMLDIADALESMLGTTEVPLSEQQVECLALEIAKNKDAYMQALKGGKPQDKPAKGSEKTAKVTSLKQNAG